MKPHQVFDLKTRHGRIGWLMEKLWGGSQTKMAEDLGLSQGTIANVLSGRRKPGRALLATVAAHPLVNEDWLREGTGRPLVLEATDAAGQSTLPIAKTIFPGMPDDHPDCLQDVCYAVPRHLYRRSRYWMSIDDPSHPFAKEPTLAIQAGDRVLMEPDQGNWPRDLRGKLCLVEVSLPEGGLLFLCRNVEAKNGIGTTWDLDFLEQPMGDIEDHRALFHEGRPKRGFPGSESGKKNENLKRRPFQLKAVAIYRCGEL